MFISFFLELRAAKVPASLREFLTLMEAMREGVARFDIDEFYYLARSTLVKDERHLDRFDRVFGHCFKGIETPADPQTELPEEWLRKLAERHLTEEEKKLVEALGGWDKLMETLRQRLAEQKRRHLAVRRVRLQPGRGADRAQGRRRGRQPHRGQGVGPARVPQSRRHRRTR